MAVICNGCWMEVCLDMMSVWDNFQNEKYCECCNCLSVKQLSVAQSCRRRPLQFSNNGEGTCHSVMDIRNSKGAAHLYQPTLRYQI